MFKTYLKQKIGVDAGVVVVYMMVVAFSNASRVIMSRVRAPRCSMRNSSATAFLQSARFLAPTPAVS